MRTCNPLYLRLPALPTTSYSRAVVMLLSLGLCSIGYATHNPVSPVWVHQSDGGQPGADRVADIAIAPDGNLIAVGYKSRAGSAKDLWVAKLSRDTGMPLWERHFGGFQPASANDDAAVAVAVDNAGSVYAAGYTVHPPTGRDLVVVKYGPNGETVNAGESDPSNQQLFTEGPYRVNLNGFNDEALDIVVDSTTLDVYVTGYLTVSGGATRGFIGRINGVTGHSTKERHFGGPTTGVSAGHSIALASDGDPVVTGVLFGTPYVIKVNRAELSDGVVADTWQQTFAGGSDDMRKIVAGGGAIYAGGRVSGGMKVYAFNNAGTLLWASSPGQGIPGLTGLNEIFDLCLDPGAGLYACGYSQLGGQSTFAAAKLALADGAKLWVKEMGSYSSQPLGASVARRCALGPDNSVVLAGPSGGYMRSLAVHRSNGEPLWTTLFTPVGGSGSDDVWGVASEANSVFLGGESAGVVGGPDYTALRYDSPGPAIDVTAACLVTRSGLRKNLRTGRWAQTATVKNIGGADIPAPISLVLNGLSPTAELFNKDGVAAVMPPASRPYKNIPAAAVLAPSASLTVTLEFSNPSNAPIGWTHSVVAGDGLR